MRYALIDFQGGNQTDLPSEVFPPTNSENKRYYMNGLLRTLQETPTSDDFKVSYTTENLPGRASFQMTFDKETHFVGYQKQNYLWK